MLTFRPAEFLRRSLLGWTPASVRPAPREGREGGSGYVSEFTDFMDHFLDDHPEVVRDQHRGWYIWWNRKVDFRDLVRASRDTVPTAGYYYFDNPPTTPDAGDKPSGGPSPSPNDQRH